jgi:hypothetical protein
MFKKLFSKQPTSKFDVVMALAAAIIAGWKAVDTVKDYKSDHEENEK